MPMKYFVLMLLSVALTACKYQSPDILTISFDFPENQNDTVNIFYNSPFDIARSENHMVILDSSGHGDIQLDWGNYIFAKADINGRLFPVFTYPYGELTIAGNTEDLPGSINFSGTGAKVNDYLVEVSKIYTEHAVWNDQFFVYLDSIEFLERRKTIQLQIEALKTKYFDEIISSATLIQILNLENEFQSMWQLFNYELVNQINMKPDVTTLLDNSSFLNTRSINYSIALTGYLQSRISRSIWDKHDRNSIDSITYIFPRLIYDEIMSLETADQLKELLIAQSLGEDFGVGRLTPSVLTTYDLWQKSFPKSEYAPTLNKLYQSILTLESGIIAPEISGITPDGDSILLSALKGKVVYIDVWATWCSPCVKSLPDLINLQQELAEYDEVVFLNISFDRDLGKWRNMIESRQIPGIHIITDSKSFRDDYMIGGIPRYILIDQNGSVFDANAPSPSADGLKDDIVKLVEQGK